MGALKLGAYILDHDEKSFYIKNGTAEEIKYSSEQVAVNGESRPEILQRNYNNYIDFKFSFDELNFDSEQQAVNKLGELAQDIAGIEIIKNNKTVTDSRQMKISDNFDDLPKDQQEKAIKSFIEKEYKNTKDIGTPQVLGWERTQNGWGKEIVDIKIKKFYGRTENMEDSIISIHTQSRDEVVTGKSNYKVKPHVHIVIPKNHNWGKDLCYLRQELDKKLVEHNLTSSQNLDIKRDRKSPEYKEYRVLKDRLTNFSWVVNKHEKGEFIIKQLNQYKRNDNCVKLDNVEQKLNRYLELGGSYDFAEKLQINLREKLGVDIALKKPRSYLRAEQNVSEGNHRQIIKEVRNNALNGEKISRKYKDYAKEVLKRDKVSTYKEMREFFTAKAIKGVVKNRGYYLDDNWNKVIDKQKINEIADKYEYELDYIDRMEFKKKLEEKIDNRQYLSQSELRKDMKRAGISDIREVSNLSEVAIVFQSNEKYIKANLDYGLEPIGAYHKLKEQINDMELDISDNWKSKIAGNIYEENYKDKAEKMINKRLSKARTIKQSYNTIKQGYKQLKDKIKNIAGHDSENVLTKEINSVKNQAQQTILLINKLENALDNLSNINLDVIDDKLNRHEKALPKYEKIESLYTSELEKLDKQKADPKVEIEKLVETRQKYEEVEFKLIGNTPVQHYEDKVEKAERNIKDLQQQKEKLENKGFISSLFSNEKEEIAKIDKQIKIEKSKLESNKEIVETVEKLRRGKREINNKLKKLRKQEKTKSEPKKTIKKTIKWDLER